ncbi:hypothetical protein LJK87_43275 [Paenibacillus sp. P25]|nr:hypothetical protein LJK87_43275 [Paenibacillus sp. P25]
MGKPTGFIEYNRETPAEAAPLMRIAHWKEFSVPMPEDKLQQAGCALYGLRHSVLPHRQNHQRHGVGSPGQ